MEKEKVTKRNSSEKDDYWVTTESQNFKEQIEKQEMREELWSVLSSCQGTGSLQGNHKLCMQRGGLTVPLCLSSEQPCPCHTELPICSLFGALFILVWMSAVAAPGKADFHPVPTPSCLPLGLRSF